MKALLGITLLCAASCVHATAQTEAARLGERINYDNNTFIEVSCEEDPFVCDIKLMVRGQSFQVTQKELGTRATILPRNVQLTYTQGIEKPSVFTVQFETTCDRYAIKPPSYFCLARIHIQNGVISSIAKTKRTQIDEPIIE